MLKGFRCTVTLGILGSAELTMPRMGHSWVHLDLDAGKKCREFFRIEVSVEYECSDAHGR